MKKLIAILVVMIVLAGVVFADGNGTVNAGTQRITLKSDVEERLPNFLLQGSMTDYETALVNANEGAAFAGTELDSEKSIADENIVAYFVIIQNASKKFSDGSASDYARTQKTITFTFAIGNLTQQGVQTPKVINGALVAQSAVAAAAGTYEVENDANSPYTNLITNSVEGQTFTARYNGRVQNGQEIGRFAAQWNKDITAPNGTYKADITVLIAVQ